MLVGALAESCGVARWIFGNEGGCVRESGCLCEDVGVGKSRTWIHGSLFA